MKEFMRLRPGTNEAMFRKYKKLIQDTAIELLEPCKGHGRSDLASLIGRFHFEQHNEMTLICAGVKERPATKDEQMNLSIKIAVAGLLIGAVVKLMEDPNTQWNYDTLIYYQLINHFENLESENNEALMVRL